MKNISKFFASFAAFSFLLIASVACAEEFIPIGDGFECVRYSNGNEFVIKAHSGADYEFADSKAWANALAKERAKIRQREQDLKDLAPKYSIENPDPVHLKTFKKYFKSYLFGLTFINLQDVNTRDERKEAVAALRQGFKDRKATIAIYLARIKECNEGQIKLPKNVSYTYPEVRLVGFKGTPAIESYGGFILIDQARKNKFSKKPTGFTGCLKLFWKNGSITGLYTGMGTEPCNGTPGLFQFATAQCNATLQKGQVGFPLQKAQGMGASDDLVNYLMSLALADKPQAIFMITPVDMSRDKAVALCDSFLNK